MFVLSSCTEFVDDVHFYVDPRLKEAVDKIYIEAEARGKHYTKDRISFVIGDISSVGLCSKRGTFCTITVNSSLFKYGNPDQLALEYIVMHEFGHYIGREHTDTFSIMNPNTYAGTYRNDKYERIKLIDELLQ